MAIRAVLAVMKIALVIILLSWTMMAPLAWILRDGLGPKAVDSVGVHAVGRFAERWGVPALVITTPLVGVWWVERRVVR
jgi:hypothetical protein